MGKLQWALWLCMALHIGWFYGPALGRVQGDTKGGGGGWHQRLAPCRTVPCQGVVSKRCAEDFVVHSLKLELTNNRPRPPLNKSLRPCLAHQLHMHVHLWSYVTHP